MLMRLPNGNYIDPTQILEIKTEILPERVIVVLKGITVNMVTFSRDPLQ
jgi:mRNA degradation ribonuclease J1/J2